MMEHYNDPSVAAYFDSIRGIALLSADDETRLSRATRRGDMAARARMIEANLLLVADIARKYVGNGLDYLDLIMAGNEALIIAVDRFDPALDNRFSSFAYDAIGGAIYRAIQDTGRTIRIPVYLADMDNRARKSGDERPVTLQQPLSLDAPTCDEPDAPTLGEMIADEATLPDDRLVKQELYRKVQRAFMLLDADERKLLRLRFGFTSDGRVYTYRQLAAFYSVSQTTIQNRERRALAKLRARLLPDDNVVILKTRRGITLQVG